VTDPHGVATTLTYAARGWLASRSTSGETTSYEYNFKGNLKKVTLPDGSWLYYHDAADGSSLSKTALTTPSTTSWT
jgi:YD repeat-containing protein